MSSWEPCPLCGQKAVYVVGGIKRVRKHLVRGMVGQAHACVVGGVTLVEAIEARAQARALLVPEALREQ